MVYLLSQFFSITPDTVAIVFVAEFVLLMVYTHWMVSRHRARQTPEYQGLCLGVDNT